MRVSNPLGWEGDVSIFSTAICHLLVSNPLGWEGDCRIASDSCSRNSVSNPLGWEGDNSKNNPDKQIWKFLIH